MTESGYGILITSTPTDSMYILGFSNDTDSMNEIIHNWERDDWGNPIEDEDGHEYVLGTGTIVYARRCLQNPSTNLLLWIDEDPSEKNLPVNLKASWIYGSMIRGDALLYYEDRNNYSNVIDMTAADLARFEKFCDEKMVEFTSGV